MRVRVSHTAWEVGKPTTWEISDSDKVEMMVERRSWSCGTHVWYPGLGAEDWVPSSVRTKLEGEGGCQLPSTLPKRSWPIKKRRSCVRQTRKLSRFSLTWIVWLMFIGGAEKKEGGTGSGCSCGGRNWRSSHVQTKCLTKGLKERKREKKIRQ